MGEGEVGFLPVQKGKQIHDALQFQESALFCQTSEARQDIPETG